jgi:hypothetical protein
VRYPLVGGTRQHRFDGTSLEPMLLLVSFSISVFIMLKVDFVVEHR